MHTILIVEDEAAAAMHLRKYLENEGYRVVGQAFTGVQAVQQARLLSPELILMDIVLQGEMNGIEASEIITSELGSPILFISAFSDEGFVKKAASVNPYGYILKPFQEKQIKVAIEVAFKKIASDRQVRDSREEYHQMLRNTSEGMLVVQDGIIANANQRSVVILGHPLEKIVSRPFLDFFHPDDRDGIRDGYEKRLGGQEILRPYVCRLAGKKGTERWVELSFITMTWEGKPAVLFLFSDITGRRLALEESNKYRAHLEKLVEERTEMLIKTSTKLKKEIEEQRHRNDPLKESAEEWRSLFESSRDVVYALNEDGRIIDINAAGALLLGYTRDELLSLHLRDILSDGTDAASIEKAIAQEGLIRDHPLTLKRKDGTKVKCLMTSHVITDGGYRGILKELSGGGPGLRPAAVSEAGAPKDRQKDRVDPGFTFQNIVSRNQRMLDLFKMLPQIARSDSTVLIEGKSGTGKELIARAVHSLSRRKSGPFVAINCAALPETLLESELFGYMKGAFTNAVGDKPGRFALADGGTILLDEIGELSPVLQVKLLRVIQEKEIEPLGGTKPVRVDVRIISSTNRNIAEEIRKGNFREDLFFRLNVVKIELPELKDRKEDIPLLIDHILGKVSAKIGKEVLHVSDNATEFLMKYDYPGNVRELENIIESAAVLCEGNTITLEDIVNKLLSNAPIVQSDRPTMIKDAMSNVEKELIKDTLARADGDRGRTAVLLNMDRSTLWRKMKKYGLL